VLSTGLEAQLRSQTRKHVAIRSRAEIATLGVPRPSRLGGAYSAYGRFTSETLPLCPLGDQVAVPPGPNDLRNFPLNLSDGPCGAMHKQLKLNFPAIPSMTSSLGGDEQFRWHCANLQSASRILRLSSVLCNQKNAETLNCREKGKTAPGAKQAVKEVGIHRRHATHQSEATGLCLRRGYAGGTQLKIALTIRGNLACPGRRSCYFKSLTLVSRQSFNIPHPFRRR
jgi:hypothetical protein